MSTTPTWAQVLAAVAVIEAFIQSQLTLLKERFPDHAALINQVAAILAISTASMAALKVLLAEIEVLVAGSGPVDHDPVDLA